MRGGFDLLSSKSTGQGSVIIGHANGVITINLAESLDDYRESMRIRLDEPYRTMLGRFRHEVGHSLRSVGMVGRRGDGKRVAPVECSRQYEGL